MKIKSVIALVAVLGLVAATACAEAPDRYTRAHCLDLHCTYRLGAFGRGP